MPLNDIIAQSFGIAGLIIIVISFQCKKNKNFFIMQGLGSLMFFINFFMIGAYGGAFFNLVNFVRGSLFAKNADQKYKIILVNALYCLCFVFSVILAKGDYFQIFLTALPFVTLFIMSILMWKGNGITIRKFQLAFMSPSWIIHNIFNFSLGGLICETFNMVSVVIFFIRCKKDQNGKKLQQKQE